MIQEVVQQIENTARAIVNEVHTALPGRIISYDATRATARIQPIGKFKTSKGKVLDYPILSEVPVMFPFSYRSNVGIAFPIVKGDTCLLIVSEVELDEWRSGATSEGSLHFDLTNAVAIPGLYKTGSKIAEKAIEKRAVIIGASGTEISISGEGVEIAVDEVTFTVSDSGIALGGDLLVKGDISYTGSLKKVDLDEIEKDEENTGDSENGTEEV